MDSGEGGRAAITGVGLACPLGLAAGEAFDRLVAGESGLGPIPAMESALPPGSRGGQCPDLAGDFRPDLPREARYLRWALDAAWAQAEVPAGARVALILGTTLHGIRAGGRFLRSDDPRELAAFLAGDTIRLATQGLAIDGLRVTTCSACSSSLGAIALADTWLAAGEADVVLAGGYDPISEYAWAGFHALRVVSPGEVRPFARGRTGMMLAEAYAIVALERAGHATQRGREPLAFLAGWGESADAFHLTRPEPGGAGAQLAMREALNRAGISGGQLDLIAAHATATPDNDAAEAAALGAVLEGAATPVIALKSALGHTLGGAGATELIFSLLAMRRGTIPPTLNTAPAEVEFPAIHLNTAPRPAAIRHTLNTSLGFGGANTCMVLARDEAPGQATSRRQVRVVGMGVLVPAPGELAIPDAVIELHLNARRARRMSPYVKLQLAAANLALASAQLAADAIRAASVLLGTAHGSTSYCYDYYSQIVREGPLAANPMLFAEGVPNAAAAQLSLMLGITGGCQTLIGSATAGVDALRLAVARIATGAADRIIVGAAEEPHPSIDRAYAACQPGLPPSCAAAVALVLEAEGLSGAPPIVPPPRERLAGSGFSVSALLDHLCSPAAATLAGHA